MKQLRARSVTTSVRLAYKDRNIVRYEESWINNLTIGDPSHCGIVGLLLLNVAIICILKRNQDLVLPLLGIQGDRFLRG